MIEFNAMLFQWLALLTASSMAFANHDPEGSRALLDTLVTNPPQGFACGALSELLKANGGKVPATIAEWEKALAPFGMERTEMVFSDALGQTDLGQLRYLYRLETSDPTKTDLTNQFFLGIGTGLDGKPLVEFFSANPVHGGFDVGTIQPGKRPPIHLEAMDRCSECHHNQGPIFRGPPWSNSLNVAANLVGHVHRLRVQDPKSFTKAFDLVEKARKDPKAGDTVIGNQIRFGTDLMQIGATPLKSGVPLMRGNLAEKLGTISSPGTYQAAVESTNDAQLVRQFYSSALAPKKRQGLLSDIYRVALTQSFESVALSLGGYPSDWGNQIKKGWADEKKKLDLSLREFQALPAAKGPLLVDRNHVTGKVTPFSTDNSFGGLEKPPTDDDLERLFRYDDERRETFKKGKNPLAREDSMAGAKNHVSPTRPFGKGPGPDALGLSAKDKDLLIETLKAAAKKVNEAKNDKDDPSGPGRKAVIDAVKELEKAPEFQEILSMWRPPKRMEIIRALVSSFDRSFSKSCGVKTFAEVDLKRFERPELDAGPCLTATANSTFVTTEHSSDKRCSRCHSSDDPPGKYLADLDKWQKALDSPLPDVRKDARSWLDGVYGRVISDGDMPPPKSLEAKEFKESAAGKELIQFLIAEKAKKR